VPLTVETTLPENKTDRLLERYQNDWNAYAREVLGVALDPRQQEILHSVQVNRRTTVRSGHARGKDFVAAVAALCFLYLYIPSKVIGTAPTSRQTRSIMMAEVGRFYKNANRRLRGVGHPGLGGRLLTERIDFEEDPTHFLEVFKAQDREVEDWTGYHSKNILVIVTEASGLEQETFDAIEGLLTGNSRLLIVGNPHHLSGEFYHSDSDKRYTSFTLSCLDAPNVITRKEVIPGQVDWEWVNDKIGKRGWTMEVQPEDVCEEFHDFEWEGRWYRPTDLFLVRVLGEYPRESENQLIPRAWLQAATERWDVKYGGIDTEGGELLIGTDVAGMGRNYTVDQVRHGPFVWTPRIISLTKPMEIVGAVKTHLEELGAIGIIDAIGEGAGTFSRLEELDMDVYACKFSETAVDLTDVTETREFLNMRAYCYWRIRDALNPAFDGDLALPLHHELLEDLAAMQYGTRSNGKIFMVPKEEIAKILGRSPDFSDALAITYYPLHSKRACVAGGGDVSPERY